MIRCPQKIICSEIFPIDRSGRPDKPYTFKIFTRTMPNPIEVAVDSEEQMNQWLDSIDQCTSKMAGEVCNEVDSAFYQCAMCIFFHKQKQSKKGTKERYRYLTCTLQNMWKRVKNQ